MNWRAAVVQWFKNFGRDGGGASSIEYALIAALMAVIVIASLTAIGSSLKVGLLKIGADMSSPQDVAAG